MIVSRKTVMIVAFNRIGIHVVGREAASQKGLLFFHLNGGDTGQAVSRSQTTQSSADDADIHIHYSNMGNVRIRKFLNFLAQFSNEKADIASSSLHGVILCGYSLLDLAKQAAK